MLTKRKFYRTIFTVEVLSEEHLGNPGLADLDELITTGPCSGDVVKTKEQIVSGKKMARLLLKQSSDPEFFCLDKNGKDTGLY